MIWILIKNYHIHQQCLELGTIINEITKYFSLHGRGGEGLGDANPGCLGTGGLCHSVLQNANSKTPHQKISKLCFSECLCQCLSNAHHLISSIFSKSQVLFGGGVRSNFCSVSSIGMEIKFMYARILLSSLEHFGRSNLIDRSNLQSVSALPASLLSC